MAHSLLWEILWSFLKQEDITRQFHVAHFRGCATLLIQDNACTRSSSKSIYVLALECGLLGPVVSKSSIQTHSEEWQVELHSHFRTVPQRAEAKKKRSIAVVVFFCSPYFFLNIRGH